MCEKINKRGRNLKYLQVREKQYRIVLTFARLILNRSIMAHLFHPKLLSVLKQGYTKQQFTKDLFAGIIVGIVALPLAIAFAVASGVSPEKGLITAVVAGLIISALGGSRVQIGGPTGAFIVIVFGILQTYGFNGLLISTMMAGVILILFGVFKLGSLLKFIPHPLVVGFTSGIALVIFSTQIKDALGLQIEKIPSDFIPKWGTYFSNLSSVNLWAVGITIVTILITIFFKKITTKNTRVVCGYFGDYRFGANPENTGYHY